MLVETSTLIPNALSAHDSLQVYNGLDCAITLEVHEALQHLFNQEPEVYRFELALQAPALEMMLRGWKVDLAAREANAITLRLKLLRLTEVLDELSLAVWDKPLNPRSPQQLQKFFYGALHLPEQWTSQKGVRKLSMNRETLEKLEVYFHAQPIISTILAIRETAKQLEVLETSVDGDGRWRTSYNIGGTTSGRWSSSASATGTGSNQQNIDPELRFMFIADEGYVLVGIDLEQAESREVGWTCGTLFDDWSYLDACEKGDLHTTTARLVWPSLPWTGEAKADRKVAESPFYRHFSHRDMSKRGGHGCLTADHEVLTPSGWVPIAEKPLVLMTWSPEKSDFALASSWEDKEFDGDFFLLQGTSVDLYATSDHRIVYFPDRRNPIKEVPACFIPKTGSLPLGWGFVGGCAPMEPEMARLIAAYQADGHQKSTNRLEFHFHKERKFERLSWLAACNNLTYERRGDKAFIHASGLPRRPGGYLLEWPPLALDAYLDEQKYWDGHQSATAVSLHSADLSHLEWIQTVGRLRGIGGNIQKPRVSGYGTTMYTLQQNNRRYASMESLTVQEINGTRHVYCPTVPSGAFYVRRNGKISVTGNSNYLGTPFTMARHLKVPTGVMETFQRAYFLAYPGLQKWHQWVAQQLQTVGSLTTPFGRRRTFFGRPNDPTTIREAVAFGPQSATADRMNLGLWRIWHHYPEFQLLGQVHDAVYGQLPVSTNLSLAVPKLLSLISTPFTAPNGRIFDVPGEVKTGLNWGAYHPDKNPNGLKKFLL